MIGESQQSCSVVNEALVLLEWDEDALIESGYCSTAKTGV
jgi:hypothetical protein